LRRLKPKRPADPFARSRPTTLGGWLALAERLYGETGAALGQIATSAHDEALYLILHSLGLPLESPPEVLKRRISASEHEALVFLFQRRLIEHTPAAYLTHEAWLGGQRFYVDPRVLIPRSYFLELIGGELDRWIPKPKAVRSVVDVCTGSGCLAILLAQHFGKARVDAVDL
jgi:ribosomal protein L3 glutamine methyltransferase